MKNQRAPSDDAVADFVRESNLIEGIERPEKGATFRHEVLETRDFLALRVPLIEAVERLQGVYAPGKPLRDQKGMDVRVGSYIAPPGHLWIRHALLDLLGRVSNCGKDRLAPWREHVAFESLHPFMDGNGRTGRALWAWHMIDVGQDPFALPFLHRFYYQTLDASGR